MSMIGADRRGRSSGSIDWSTSHLRTAAVTETGKVDLHLHSTASDGRLSPVDLMELAYRNGVRRLALTDHDTTDGVAAAVEVGRRLGLEVFSGIELSTDIPGTEVHILGIFIDHQQGAFQETLAEFRRARFGRAERMVEKLSELGVSISWTR